MASTANAPKFQSTEVETLQIADNTLVATNPIPMNDYREWVAQYIDLEVIDRSNGVLNQEGVNMDLEEILWKLADNESGRNPDIGCIIDVNGLESCGMFQYQRATWQKNCQGDITSGKDQMACTIKLVMDKQGLWQWTSSWFIKKLPVWGLT